MLTANRYCRLLHHASVNISNDVRSNQSVVELMPSPRVALREGDFTTTNVPSLNAKKQKA